MGGRPAIHNIEWEGEIYSVLELNAREYLKIEQIIRRSKNIAPDGPLEMKSGDFSIALLMACVTKNDGERLTWEEVEEMPAKLFQALLNEANRLNTLSPEEERSLFFGSSMEGRA